MSVSKERLGQLFILVGPGGVGKNALMNEVIKKIDDLWQLPTATTRPIRPGEKEGREHQFVSLEVFQQMIADKKLIEYQEVHPGKFYGVPRDTVERAISERQDMIADIEVLGTRIIREAYPQNSMAIFIAPPSIAVLEERLRGRKASAEDIQDRLNRLPMEMLYAPLADYLIVNDDFDLALDDMCCIVEAVRAGRDVVTAHIPQVRYEARVVIRHKQAILRSDKPLKRYFDDRRPIDTAKDIIESVLKQTTNTQAIQFARIDDQLPVEINYQPENHIYQVIYHYLYELSERVNQDDLHWEPL